MLGNTWLCYSHLAFIENQWFTQRTNGREPSGLLKEPMVREPLGLHKEPAVREPLGLLKEGIQAYKTSCILVHTLGTFVGFAPREEPMLWCMI